MLYIITRGCKMKRLFSFLLILFVLGLFYNNTVNWHYHKLSSGLVIEHAHPYARFPVSPETPYEEHHHSDFEYLILESIYYSGLIIVFLFLGIRTFFDFNEKIKHFISSGKKSDKKFDLPLLRAPPVYTF